MKRNLISLIIILFVSTVVEAQKKVEYEVGISSAFGKGKELPFWFHSNKRGITPDRGFVMGDFSMAMDFDESRKQAFDFMWEASGAGYTGHDSKVLADQLYAGIRWKFLDLYLGQKSHALAYDGLSSTNGDLLYSNNARAYPQYELSVSDWTSLPFVKGLISFKGLLSDGITKDDRYIDNARIHHKNFFLRIFKDYKFSASAGVEHYALWGGTHPVHGDISSSLDKYIKIFRVEGDDAGTFGNDNYRLGDHIGSYRFDLYYNDKNISLNAYHQTVFEDGSGSRMNSVPDGLYGIYYRNKAREGAFVQSAVLEFYHTTDQCGEVFMDGDKMLGGRDNYFNHSEYRSGWTHYGRTIGSPLFTTGMSGGHTVIANNRFKAVHMGVFGHIGVLPYKTYFTYSKNHGTYFDPYASTLNQFSGYVEVTIPASRIPFKIDFACAVDEGELLKDNIGLFVRLSKSGIIKW
ncbi:MAG: capsule assembly Wzi family protein [Marinifilaceae bacterium]